MRYTIVDATGTTSFVAPCSVLKALVAGCATDPTTVDDLLAAATPYDDNLATYVGNGLARFDERNSVVNTNNIAAGIKLLHEEKRVHDLPPFRGLDDLTRDASLDPVQAGLVIFNLGEKRIVQVQNSYWPVQRADRSRIRRDGKPLPQLYYYTLPEEWKVL